MNSFRAIPTVTLVTIALAFSIRIAGAGSFLFEDQCQVTSTDPLRYRLRFLLMDTHMIGPFCEVRLDPVSVNGSALHPVLAGSAPSALHLTIDPAGSARFTATPCAPDPWRYADSLFVIVDGVPAYFNAYLFTTNGVLLKSELAQFPCSNPVSVDPGLPHRLWLGALSPNPARSVTALPFGLPRETHVRLAIYDLAGRRLRTVVDALLPAGVHTAAWDLRDQEGHEVPSGLYLARLDAEGMTLRRRLIRTR